MRALTIKLILPLTIISFGLFTKWWYALPLDGVDKLFWGFPFAYMGEGFHTSSSIQFFFLEFFADLCIYFLCWLMLFWAFKKIMTNKKIIRICSRIAWTLAILFIAGGALLLRISYPIFHIKRPYEWQVMTSGYVFIWQQTPYPDIQLYHPSRK
jgi:hypothetical protein